MTDPHAWKHGWADAYAQGNSEIAAGFLSSVVSPSLFALERMKEEFGEWNDEVAGAFAGADHSHLMRSTVMAFCLSIQSLWEQQIRRYLITCAHSLKMTDVLTTDLESKSWGPKFDALFLKVRGRRLPDFDSYPRLTLLHMLGNACRHGDGKSSRALYAVHPELWPPQHPSFPLPDGTNPPFSSIVIPVSLLSSFVDAIVLFWMDMERYGLESFWDGDKHVGERIESLKIARTSRL